MPRLKAHIVLHFLGLSKVTDQCISIMPSQLEKVDLKDAKTDKTFNLHLRICIIFEVMQTKRGGKRLLHSRK